MPNQSPPNPPSPPIAQPTRVAFCIGQLEVGGAERCLVELATRLDRQKFELRVYCLDPEPPAPRGALVAQLRAAGIEPRFLGLRRWRPVAAAVRLAGAFRRDRPAIVQSFLYRANMIASVAARLARVDHFVTGIRVADPRRGRLWLERRLTRNADRIVCVSQSVAEYARTAGRFSPDKLMVIPNGVSMERFRGTPAVYLSQLGVPAGRRGLCVIGRLDKQKNIEWLLAEAPALLEILPGHDLILVGDGPRRKKLERQAAESPIAGRVHFVGWQENVPGILAACDLLLLPSAWEGMPNVLLEAMATGRPVVAADVEGVRQVLGSLAPQQIFPAGDGRLMKDRVTAILGNPDLAARLGAENQRRAEHEFSPKIMVAAYEQLYQSLLRE
ncbi:MAG: glycosyltransferase [Planctomycetia bacterium]|nr:glycosyltransferase [Planctomycetia bacterium]